MRMTVTTAVAAGMAVALQMGAVQAQAPPAPPAPPAPRAADGTKGPQLGPGIKIYIEKMAGDLDGFIRAELMKKKVPVSVVLDEESADFIMTGAASERKSSWHEGWLSAQKDNSTGSVMIFAKETKELVWAEEAGDRSLMWGSFARGGPRKVASRIADRLKDHLHKR